MIVFPNAKINLGLNIVEKRPDGYHNLETVFYPINLQDALEVTRLEGSTHDFRLHVSGHVIEGNPEDNLVVKAYRLLQRDFEMPAIDIHMYKHIPSGAGLGGGSSDCAFMIKLLNDKFSLGLSTEQMEAYAAQLCLLRPQQTCICHRHRQRIPAHRPFSGRLPHRIGETRHLRIHTRCLCTNHSTPSRSIAHRNHP